MPHGEHPGGGLRDQRGHSTQVLLNLVRIIWEQMERLAHQRQSSRFGSKQLRDRNGNAGIRQDRDDDPGSAGERLHGTSSYENRPIRERHSAIRSPAAAAAARLAAKRSVVPIRG